MLKNRLSVMRYGDVLEFLGFGGLGAVFLFVLYYGFVRLLWEVHSVEMIGSLLIVKLMAMAFLTTFLMIVFSSTLASFTTLFFAQDLPFLVQSPLPFRSVFLFKAVETAAFSSWMVLLAMWPFLAAYGFVYGLGKGFWVFLAAMAVPFVLIACTLGIGLSLALMCVFPSRRVREVMLLLGVFVGGSLYVLFRWLQPEKLVRADSFEVLIQYIALLEAPLAPYLPSWWMTSAVAAYTADRGAGLLADAGLLAGAAVLLGSILVFFAEKAYYFGWTSAQESGRRQGTSALGREWRWVPRFFPSGFRGLVGKDALLFVRDANQWSQLLLLLALVAVYLISIDKLPLDNAYLKGLISFLNIGMVGFVLSSVALRFVFPAVSLEGKCWWLVRTAPFGLGTVLMEKVLLGFFPLCVLGVALVWASNRLLGVDVFVTRLSVTTIGVMSFALCAMGVGLGARFPRFGVENVPQIETSPGGLLFMVSSLFYVGATISLEAVLMRMHYYSVVRANSAWDAPGTALVLAALFLLNAAVVLGPLLAGKRYLERADV
ncbi:MAG TPA: hypothetical protein P5079_01075 [Elusimicrobiota bacterium]|nr:hypothetical protein [Elusimicrobiota bacterium]